MGDATFPDVVRCLMCERVVDVYNQCLDGAGLARVSFGYGSRYDQGPAAGAGRPREAAGEVTADALVDTGRVRAAVCDECFEARPDLFWAGPPAGPGRHLPPAE